ncbi:MAG: YdcH family protein [Burkholderiales bacterium]
MQILPNDLDHEFPEFSGVMHQLRQRDPALGNLCDHYDRVNGAIVQIEKNGKPVQDTEFEEMKKKRLRIKDEIYRALLAHKR